MKWLLLIGACAACGTDSTDVVGPFTGDVHHYHLDSLQVPRDSTSALAVAADLDGDGAVENQFGNVTGVLTSTTDLSTDSDDMIKGGAIASLVDIQTNSADDPTTGVTFYGASGEPAVAFGGALTGGHFLSNRTATTQHPGMATVHLPVFTNADPIVLPLEAAELELTQDATGYAGVLRGVCREDKARDAAFAGLIQMFQDEPQRHLVFSRGVDTNHDGVVSRDEVDMSVINLLVTADVDMFDGTKLAPHPNSQANDSISVAFSFHIADAAPTGAPTDHCRDRVKDADETDIDCGGSCQKCWDAKRCSVAADCQSNSCIMRVVQLDTQAMACADATCSDGVRDAFESDVDCGGPCAPCAKGAVCANKVDCASMSCDNGVASLGHCQ